MANRDMVVFLASLALAISCGWVGFLAGIAFEKDHQREQLRLRIAKLRAKRKAAKAAAYTCAAYFVDSKGGRVTEPSPAKPFVPCGGRELFKK